ncbi:MAG: hypothetical protein E7319_00450 [Clostridiales bacterium]|nr:hypothetical protein [Clostridiales bacterium]
MPEGRLATGYHHTVVLRDDGTVLAYGDNSCGQTDVAQWQQVVAVVAGAYHTVALTADGRVLATGDNTYGQTDVEMFRGVKQIAASAWNTYLLLESGQIMSIGYRNDDFALELASVEQIAAGSYGLLARAQGTNHASHPGLVLDDRCRQFSVSRGYAIGVDDQGKTLCTLDQVPTWDRIARVSAGENAVLALTEDGQIQSHIFGSHVACSFDFGQPVLAISAGPNHYAFVLQDGSIEIRYADGTVETPEQRIW